MRPLLLTTSSHLSLRSAVLTKYFLLNSTRQHETNMSEASVEVVGKKRKISYDESGGCRVTKNGRMQCEGIANSGKRCLSFEPTHGARFCSTHALSRTVVGDESGHVTKDGRARCEGIINPRGKQCLYFEEKPGARFCKTHAYQEASQRLGRVCCGSYHDGYYFIGNLTPCSAFVPFPASGPVLPPFCSQHTNQAKSVRVERCQWSDENRACCFRYVPISSSQYFCKEHIVHAKCLRDRSRPITTMSDDLLMTIMDKLLPEERVAFALTSRASASLVKAWGTRDAYASWSSAAALEPIVLQKAPTAQKFTIVAGSDPTDWDVLITRKSTKKSVVPFSKFSVASLAALNTDFRHCMQSGTTCRRCGCSSRVDRWLTPRPDGPRVAMTLIRIEEDAIAKAKKQFPHLFQSTQAACCPLCSTEVDPLNPSYCYGLSLIHI